MDMDNLQAVGDPWTGKGQPSRSARAVGAWSGGKATPQDHNEPIKIGDGCFRCGDMGHSLAQKHVMCLHINIKTQAGFSYIVPNDRPIA